MAPCLICVMGWQLIFKAPEDTEEAPVPVGDLPGPAPRKPVSMTLQLDPGTMAIVASGDDEEDD